MNDLNEAIKSFLNDCQYEKNLSEKTIYFYKLDLVQFTTFLRQQNYPELIQDISKFHLKHYLREISGWKIKTVKRKKKLLQSKIVHKSTHSHS